MHLETLRDILDGLRQDHARRNARNFEDAHFRLHPNCISLPMAYAMLLCDMALAEGPVEMNDYDCIFKRLRGVLGVGADETARLLRQAQRTRTSSNAITGHVREHFSAEQRQEILGLLAGITIADGKQENYEQYLRSRFATALGLH